MIDGEYWQELDALRAFVNQDVDTSLIVAAGDRVNPLAQFQAVPLLGDASQPFLEAARQSATAGIDRVRPFQPGYRPEPGEALVIELNEFPDLQAIIRASMAVEDLATFRGEAAFVEHFRAFATILSAAGERAAFFRRSSPKKELQRSGIVALVLTDRGFNDVEDRIFLFDQEVDFIAWHDRLIVRTVSALNALVPDFEVVLERITIGLRQVAPFISNADAFSEAVMGQPQMRSKLMQITARPYIERITIDDLRRQIERRRLAIQIDRGPDGVDRLVFEASRESRWLILKLLDDDFLDSRMTEEQYEVNSKLSV